MISVGQQHVFFNQLRSGPGFIGWCEQGGVFQQRWFEHEADALRLINSKSATANLWCSMARFDRWVHRNAEFASSLQSFWFDVDAHGGRYQQPDECEAAVKEFVKATGLPRPNFVHKTGHGVQVFWVLSQPISRAEWQPVADKLQELAKRLDLGADPITADAARILRVPGTLNFRDPIAPRETVLHVLKPGHTDLDAFHTAIVTALAKLSPKQVAQPKQIASGLANTPENEALVQAMLAVLDPDLDYDEWRKIVWAVAASGLPTAYEIARSWSEKAKVKSWDENKFDTIWSDFDPTREKPIGFGSLVHAAREAGYAGDVPGAEKFDELEFKQGAGSPPRRPGGLITQRAADIEPEPVEWLVEGAIPLGMMVVIGGQPGMGKSQIAIKLAAAVTTGQDLPDGSTLSHVGSVIILANEDDASRTIRPRLDAASADISKVHIVQGVAREGQPEDHFQLDTDIAALRAKAVELSDVRLIIIDPPSAYLGPKVDAYKESDVRRVLAPLAQLAQDTGALVLLVVHLNKRSDGGAQQRFGGSTAWIAAPRAAFLVAEEEGTRRRYMLPVKNNLGNDRLGFEYRVVEALLDYPAGAIKAPHIEWLGISECSATELLNPPKPKGPTALDEAKDFLRKQLAGGAQPVLDIQNAAKGAGISIASLNRAKTELGIKPVKEGSSWTWKLGSIFNG